MGKRLVIRGGFREGHWKQAHKALHGGGVVLVPAVLDEASGRVRADNLILMSFKEAKLEAFGYRSGQRLLASRSALGHLGVELSSEVNRLLDNFAPGTLSLVVRARAGRLTVMFPSAELAAHVLARAHEPVHYQEILETDSADDVKADYGDRVDLWLDAGISTFTPSTLLDVSRHMPVILRKGAASILDIEAVLGRRVKLGPEVRFTVLFICTGNTCRSAMAKGILERRLKGERVLVYSAGTHDFGRMPASEGARIIAQEYGADLANHSSVPLSRYLIDASDLVLCMEYRHRRRVVELSPSAASRAFLLPAYSGCTGMEEVFDPVGSSIAVFRKVGEQINECLNDVVAHVKERFAQEPDSGEGYKEEGSRGPGFEGSSRTLEP